MNNYLLYPTKIRYSSYNLCNFLRYFIKNSNTLFLDLPHDLQEPVRKYVQKEINIEELWNYFREQLGLQKPYINAMKYIMEPILGLLPIFFDKFPNTKLFCYQDLYFFKASIDLSEKFLLLTYRTKASSRIDVSEWKNLLFDEVNIGKTYYLKNINFVLQNLNPNGGNIIIFRSFIQKLRNELLKINKSKLKIIYLMNYWKAPLEYLSFLLFLEKKISDKLIEMCVMEHTKYIDFVLTSKNLDEAHLKWSKTKFKLNLQQKILNSSGFLFS